MTVCKAQTSLFDLRHCRFVTQLVGQLSPQQIEIVKSEFKNRNRENRNQSIYQFFTRAMLRISALFIRCPSVRLSVSLIVRVPRPGIEWKRLN